MTRCQRNQSSKNSLLSEGQFQDFWNIMKYVLSQISLLILVSWPTPHWFEHCPPFKVFDCSQCLCFHYLQIADRPHGLPKTWRSLFHPDCSWIHLKPAVRRVPCMVCSFSIQATRLWRPQVFIVAQESLSNLRKQYHLCLMLPMGIGNPPVVWVWTRKIVWFSSRPIQKTKPLSLDGFGIQTRHKHEVFWPGLS